MSSERDRATAEALRIAHEYLVKQGWRFNAADVGKVAREIIDAFDANRRTD